MDFAKNFGTNFVADFGSDVLSQGLSGHGISWGKDLEDATVDAGGSALLLGGLTDAVNPMVSGAASNMFGSLLQDRLFDGDSWSATLENVATRGVTGAAGTYLGSEGEGAPEATEAEKIGINTLVYTRGRHRRERRQRSRQPDQQYPGRAFHQRRPDAHRGIAE
jgi:hypothetical protein